MIQGRRRIAAILSAAVACTPGAQGPTSNEVVNACPDHPCTSYASPSPSIPPAECTEGGVCAVPGNAPGDLIVVVSVPQGSPAFSGVVPVFPNNPPFSIARTFVRRLDDLLDSKPPPMSACSPTCVSLPSLVPAAGFYDAVGSDARDVRSTLVSAPGASLPVHVTYRALWPSGTSPTAVDAFAAGLPIYPMVVPSGPSNMTLVQDLPPPIFLFQAALPSNVAYEQTIAPDSPYSAEFPPKVSVLTLPLPTDQSQTGNVDATGGSVPIFDLSRTQGPMDGWVAYLRDVTTKRPVSPIKPLHGNATPDGGLILPTDHNPANIDALTTAELVLSPPANADPPLPAEVFSPPGLLLHEVYAVLPQRPSSSANAPLGTGTIVWGDGQGVPADVVFEATAIYAGQPILGSPDTDAGPSMGSGDAGGEAGPPHTIFAPQPNFEFLTHVATTPLPDVPSRSTFAMPALPFGIYRVVVRPTDTDGEGVPDAVVHAVTVLEYDTLIDGSAPPPTVTVLEAPTLTGSVSVADGRGLPGAAVEALPIGCAPLSADADIEVTNSPSCMPRSAQTTTNADGTGFTLAVDPGVYWVRVRPPDGSGLPWVQQRLAVITSGMVTFSIPAPIHQALQIADSSGGLIANAIVQVFSTAGPGGTHEVASGLTDDQGNIDLYVDPSEH